MVGPERIAYTLEQCWHRVPGGTAVAALETLAALRRRADAPQFVGVAGTHDGPPEPPFAPPIPIAALPGHGARLYASWLFSGRPSVERATGPVDLVHATTIIPPPCAAPLVTTLHDLAFLHEPRHFSRWGRLVFARSVKLLQRRGALLLCSSQATADDCVHAGFRSERLRVVPLGVRAAVPVTETDRTAVRARYGLPERFVLTVGTLEPRKNVARLAAAVARSGLDAPLVCAGPDGWGDQPPVGTSVQFTGFVPEADLPVLYDLATVMAYPSLREGFGLPVLEAMAQGTPVVTSAGTATEEAAGGAAVLVDPRSIDDISRGLLDAVASSAELRRAGRARAAVCTWERTAELTLAAYAEAGAR